MKIIGIILEANPLHLGHNYFIEEVRKKFHPDLIIAITSTSFSMRGEISLLDKFTKTKLLLDENINLVFELPFLLTVHSADYFAKNAINILNQLKATDIVFGSETTDVKLYEKCYDFMSKNTFKSSKTLSKKEEFNNLLIKNFTEDEIKIIESPNFTLGLQYIKAIKDLNLNINYHLIQRNNHYYDQLPTNQFASATAIRSMIIKQQDISKYIPYSPDYLIDLEFCYQNLLTIIRYCYQINSNQTDFLLEEGIHNYIRKKGNFNNNYQDLIDSLKNKKYTCSTIRRSLLHYILNTKNNLQPVNYLRLLGCDDKGLSYINTLEKSIKNYLFSNPNEIFNKEKFNNILSILETELNATKLFGIITNKEQIIKKEYTLPIRKGNYEY